MSDIEIYIGATAILSISIFCILVHCIVLRSFTRRRQLRVPFHALCSSRSLAHLATALAILVSTVPSMLARTDLFVHFINVFTIPVAFIYISELLLALNRFVAVFMWQWYDGIWSKTVTWSLIALAWLLGTLVQIYGLVLGCYLRFDPATFLTFNSMPFCYDIAVGQLIFSTCTFASIGLNLFTFVKVIISLKGHRSTQSNVNKRIRDNARLFVFSFAQCILWLLLTAIWNFQLPAKINNRLYVLMTTFGLQLFIMLAEGCIYVALNRKEVLSKMSTTTVVQQASSQHQSGNNGR